MIEVSRRDVQGILVCVYMIGLIKLICNHIVSQLVLRVIKGEVALMIDMVVLSVNHYRAEIASILECRIVESGLEYESAVGIKLSFWNTDRSLEHEMVTDDLEISWSNIDCCLTIACSHHSLIKFNGEHLHLDIDHLTVVNLDYCFLVLS